jgi:hypothetical protein
MSAQVGTFDDGRLFVDAIGESKALEDLQRAALQAIGLPVWRLFVYWKRTARARRTRR